MLACRAMTQDVKPIVFEGQVLSTPNDNTTASSSTAQPSAPADAVSNAVSSLRALALSTLRTKRRKDAPGPPTAPKAFLPVRPVASNGNNVTLDYGSESTEDQVQPNDPVESPKNTHTVDQTTSQSAGDGDAREEGEISDEEVRSSSVSSSGASIHGNNISTDASSTKASTSAIPTKSDHLRSPFSTFSEQPTVNQDRDLWNNWVPSQDHVRPGLKMNMEQFNLVKELVLDLLGWGVSPEYLVDCGLTREAVFYTFTELNLRLPKNLDVTGLLPSPPSSSVVESSPQQSRADTTMPPPVVPVRTEVSPTAARKPSLSHPLPAKPVLFAGTTPATPVSPVITPPQNNSNGQNLSDMEAQRKLELQARKAVLASRRKKALPASSNDPETTMVPPDLSSTVLDGAIVDEPSPIAPTAAVDDFLNSMLESTSPPSISPVPAIAPKVRALSGGVALGVHPNGVNSSTNLPSSVFSPMDVDSKSKPVHGFQRKSSLPPIPSPGTPSPIVSASASGEDVTFTLPLSRSTGSTRGTTPRNSNSSSTERMPVPTSLPDKPTFLPSSPRPLPTTNGRRGTKRPVAMDFVDVDYNPGPSRIDTSIQGPPPLVRRKMGSFAGLGGHGSRRCVIELSDSEDDERIGTANEMKSWVADRLATPFDPNRMDVVMASAPITRPPSSPGPITSKPTSPGPNPASLLEKEQQIKRMKELIAQRETERLRKLVEKTRTPAATPPPPSSATLSSTTTEPTLSSPGISVSVKVEEADSIPLPASAASDHPYEASRPQSPTSSGDKADEDSVMQTLSGLDETPESSLPTPIDVSTNTFEHHSTGEPVITEEAKEESVDQLDVSDENAMDMPVDVATLDSSSAQTSLQEASPVFSTYSSPFYSYPLLRSRSRVVADLVPETHLLPSLSILSSSPFFSSTSTSVAAPKTMIPDLRPLRVAVMSREVGNDFGRRICQFEVPGGGVCHDKTCTDMHLGDLEPGDHETARYLLEAMPDTLQAYNQSEITDQLLQARQKRASTIKNSSLEDIVTDAISALVGLSR